MTVRRPLVVSAGSVKELPAGDVVAPMLLGTATKTASYTAAAGEQVLLDTTSGTPIVVTLPTAPADGTVVEAGWILGGNATATVVTGGSDTFQGGGTTSTLQYLYQFRRYHYRTSGALWTVENSMPISGLDARYSPLNVVIPSDQTGTTYTLVLTDANNSIGQSNASAITTTVPPNSSVAFPIGALVELRQVGAGQVTIAAGGGVTLRSRGGALKIAGQYGAASLLKVATDTWSVQGDLTT